MTLEKIKDKHYEAWKKGKAKDFLQSLPKEQAIVFAILENLGDRQGIGDMLGDIDDEIEEEMFQELVEEVKELL